jgi:hypothetical protein
LLWTIAVCVCVVTLGGCTHGRFAGDGGRLAVRSQSSPGTVLSSAFTTGVYGYDDQNNLTVLLFDGPPENPAQAVAIRMFWRPRAAATPIERTATNATIQYMVFAGHDDDGRTREIGVYSGAGYVYPKSRLGASSLHASVWDAALRLSDRSEGFTDLLGKAELKGGFTAVRDDIAKEQMHQRLHVLVRERLGYPRLVLLDATPRPRAP